MQGNDTGTRAALEIQGASKTFVSESGEEVRALEGLDLVVHSGDLAVLIGPTGCGKTTLLNIVAGLDGPDAGTLRLSEELRPGDNVPCVFQHYTLFPWRTLLRNVAFGLEMRHVPRRTRLQEARGLLAEVGLAGFKRAYPHELSGGMRQRAAIAQALAIQPRLLLMDEPFGALDDTTRRELQGLVCRIWQDTRMTILFVTHNIDEAIVMGERVFVFSERPGRVVKEVPVDLPRPRDRHSPAFAESFVGLRQALLEAVE